MQLTSSSSTAKRHASTQREEPLKRPRTEDIDNASTLALGRWEQAQLPEAPVRPADIPPGSSGSSAVEMRAVADTIPTGQNEAPLAPFEWVLTGDPGIRIFEHLVSSSPHPAYSRDDQSLAEAARLGTSLGFVNKRLRLRMQQLASCRPYGVYLASLRWLRTLNHLGNETRDTLDPLYLRPLVHGTSDLRLENWPDAGQARTEILVDRLFWRCRGDLSEFRPVLTELLKQTKGHTADSRPQMFIDPQHLPSSVLGSVVRHHGWVESAIDRFIYLVREASEPHRAAFWAELVIGYRADARQYSLPLKELAKLVKARPDLSSFMLFVKQARKFLSQPAAAPHLLTETMMAHLENSRPLIPSSVTLLETLVNHTSLTEDQKARLRRLLVRYIRALNGLYINVDMKKARAALSRIAGDFFTSAFDELDADDKLKLADIDCDASQSQPTDAFYFELRSWLPMIRSALLDGSISLDRRLLLVEDLLKRSPTSFASTLENIELMELERALEAELRAHAASTSTSSPS